MQPSPFASQRNQAYLKLNGVTPQVPFETFRVAPTFAVPEMVGTNGFGLLLLGGVDPVATTPVGALLTEPAQLPFGATWTTMLKPTSAAVTVYVGADAVVGLRLQPVPVALQRCHA